MAVWVFRAYAAAGAVALVAFALLPVGAVKDVAVGGLALAGAVAVLAGARGHRPLRALPWLWLAGAVALLAAGDLVWSWQAWVLHEEPFPSVADVPYLAAYPALAVAFMLLVRGRQPGRDRESLIDSSVFTISVALLCWVLLLGPTLADPDAGLLTTAVAAAYPLGGVLVVGLLVRLLTTPGARTASFRLLAAAALALLGGDAGFQLSELHGLTEVLGVDAYAAANVLFAASYLLFGAAALHPSMRQLSEPAPESAAVFTRARLAALTVASLVAPGVLAVQLLAGARLDAWAVVVSSTALFVLVVLRMAGLLARVQEQAGALATMARTDGLTGLPNRRTADAELQRLQEKALLDGLPLVVAMLDLDRFKNFNDTFGHQAGDSLLQGAATAWRTGLQGSGIVLARYGGEEFQAMAVGCTLREVQEALEGLRGTTPAGQTFSAGVAEWDRRESVTALVGRADVALYAAKRAGRDRVVTSGEAGVPAML
ncbi:hypothetical protein NUM3379_22310 [Kineococcus sp. NUM-3379]